MKFWIDTKKQSIYNSKINTNLYTIIHKYYHSPKTYCCTLACMYLNFAFIVALRDGCVEMHIIYIRFGYECSESLLKHLSGF